MTKRRARAQGSGRSAGRRTGGGGKVLLGMVLGGAAVGGAGYVYLHGLPNGRSGRSREIVPSTPAAVPPPPASVHRPEAAVVARQPPFGASEEVFEAGAAVYARRCSMCHGTPEHDATGKQALRSGQLFRGERKRVSAESPAALFAAINLGARGLGMPAYHGILTEREIWDVVLLLQGADAGLPDPVSALLREPTR